MKIIFSDKFKKEYRKIKDKLVRLKILKQLKKLEINPEVGKPLKHDRKDQRTIYVKPFRIVYSFKQDEIVILCFDHRGSVY
tara:strand:+ start:623 stop:865 length:243 start_codon:yes stop_codon:yes gene_type:complete